MPFRRGTFFRILIHHDWLDLQEEVQMMRARLNEEAAIASQYGSGPKAFLFGAMSELCRKGMRNRSLLVLCSFALQNMSGAAGKLKNFSPKRLKKDSELTARLKLKL